MTVSSLKQKKYVNLFTYISLNQFVFEHH